MKIFRGLSTVLHVRHRVGKGRELDGVLLLQYSSIAVRYFSIRQLSDEFRAACTIKEPQRIGLIEELWQSSSSCVRTHLL